MLTLKDLTPGAQLEILRKRAGQTRKQAATALNISPSTLYNWEKSITQSKVFADPEHNDLTEQEQFKLKRKLTGITQAQLAKRIGVSRYSIILMEKGRANDAALRKFWEDEWT